MAAEVGMSSASFYRHFKAAFGATPLQYFKRIRLLRAQSLIVDHGVRVAEAAHASGYSSASQFSRDFHSAFGHTPSEARRKHVERSRVAGVPFRDESDIPQG